MPPVAQLGISKLEFVNILLDPKQFQSFKTYCIDRYQGEQIEFYETCVKLELKNRKAHLPRRLSLFNGGNKGMTPNSLHRFKNGVDVNPTEAKPVTKELISSYIRCYE